MRRRMVNHIRAERFKNPVYPLLVPNGADEHGKVKVRKIPPQLLLDVIGVIFVNIKNNKAFYRVFCKLAAKLASYASAAAGYKHRHAEKVVADSGHINTNRLPPKQIFDLHASYLAYAYLAVLKLIKTGNSFKLAFCKAANIKNFLALGVCCRRNGKDDFLCAEFFRRLGDFITPADDLYAFKVSSVLLGVVVDYAYNSVFGMFAGIKLPKGDKARRTCADKSIVRFFSRVLRRRKWRTTR